MRARCVMRGRLRTWWSNRQPISPRNATYPIPFQEPNPMIFPVAFIIRCLNVAYPKIQMIFPIPIIIECLKSTPVLFRTSQQSLIQKQGKNSANPFSPNHIPKSPASLIFVLAIINII